MRAFVTALRESTHFVIDGRLAREPDKLGALGTLGHVPLGEHMTLRLISTPADPTYEPLWDVAANGMLGAIILPAGPFGAALEAITSAPISLMVRRRIPGMVRTASSWTPSITCQMSRSRLEESTRVSIMKAELTDPML